jgi:hypothetical protein
MSVYKGSAGEGLRAAELIKQREMQQAQIKSRMDQIQRESERATAAISTKFAAKVDNIEDMMKASTYGLITVREAWLYILYC